MPINPTLIRDAFIAIERSLSKAWDETRQLLEHHNPRIRKDAFGQWLYTNVQEQICRLQDTSPALDIEIKANRNQSAHHVELRVQGFLGTISAVPRPGHLPRDADFRRRIQESLQSRFSSKDGVFTFVEPLITNSSLSYIQILHGPKDGGEYREELGFIRIAFYDRFAGLWRMATITEFLGMVTSMANTVGSTDDETLLDAAPAPMENVLDQLDDMFQLPDNSNIASDDTETDSEAGDIGCL